MRNISIEIIVEKSKEAIQLSQKIRNEVFVKEQGIPLKLDLDGRDNNSYHALVYDKDIVIGVGRLAMSENNNAVLARIAITKAFRGRGIATKIVESLLVKSKQLQINSVEIHAHEYLRSFYERFGFKYIKKVEQVGEHQLIQMHLTQ